MERNWLIRTSQNQILGPVAKEKLLEFIQKGALGLTDEVTSGNGYWFALKEKDLVEKYLYGDIPQSYNPISESKSVLSKRENPEKTTSINSAPANRAPLAKENVTQGVVPKNDDLELPDITVVRTAASLKATPDEDLKLPDSDDLEFPDVAKISSAVSETFKNESIKASQPTSPAPVQQTKPEVATPKFEPLTTSDEKVLFPADNDLAFPDMNDFTSPKVDKGKVDLSHNYTRTVALDVDQASEALPPVSEEKKSRSPMDLDGDYANSSLALEPTAGEEHAHGHHLKKTKPATDDRKLLHERKTKSSTVINTAVSKGAALRDPLRENYPKEAASPALKKRNDNYIFFILIILILIVLSIFFYFKEILNKPLPV